MIKGIQEDLGNIIQLKHGINELIREAGILKIIRGMTGSLVVDLENIYQAAFEVSKLDTQFSQAYADMILCNEGSIDFLSIDLTKNPYKLDDDSLEAQFRAWGEEADKVWYPIMQRRGNLLVPVSGSDGWDVKNYASEVNESGDFPGSVRTYVTMPGGDALRQLREIGYRAKLDCD
ncbi:MAG: hypothetical protein ABIH52_02530 [Candidatus Aenigmatarchaeota archaeon]|nr:hypothetical protein [Nanoarchaeota archaeon]